ncbi:MAG: carbohydrate ABC transporter permease [Anaerolineaceae bacterium]|nr:carbohydrate ABC transporter permease [Anaerolineaceae bacterium]
MASQDVLTPPDEIVASTWAGERQGGGTRILLFIALCILGLFSFLPFYFLLTTSIKEAAEANRVPLTFIPQSFSLEHFEFVINEGAPRAMANGLFYAGVGTVLAVVVSALIGYVVVKHRSIVGNILFWTIVASSLMPLASYIVTMVTLLQRITNITGVPMLDTFQGLLLPRIVYAFGVFLMRQAMLAVPDELLDAARVDGAGFLRSFWQIALPVVRPQTITLAILIFMGLFGEFLWPLVATSTREMQVASVWLASRSFGYGVNPGVLSAGALLVIFPMLIVFLLGQRYITAGLGMTGFR